MDTGRPDLMAELESLAELRAEKADLEARIEAAQADLGIELQNLKPTGVGPVADKIRASNALRDRLAEVNALLGEAEAEKALPEAREER